MLQQSLRDGRIHTPPNEDVGMHTCGLVVVHGTGGERLANAWNAINSIAGSEGRPRTRVQSDAKPASWSWPCEKCSDPECEHKLFSDLIARRE